MVWLKNVIQQTITMLTQNKTTYFICIYLKIKKYTPNIIVKSLILFQLFIQIKNKYLYKKMFYKYISIFTRQVKQMY